MSWVDSVARLLHGSPVIQIIVLAHTISWVATIAGPAPSVLITIIDVGVEFVSAGQVLALLLTQPLGGVAVLGCLGLDAGGAGGLFIGFGAPLASGRLDFLRSRLVLADRSLMLDGLGAHLLGLVVTDLTAFRGSGASEQSRHDQDDDDRHDDGDDGSGPHVFPFNDVDGSLRAELS